MVFEQFLESEKIKRHAFFIFGMGFVYTFLSFFVSYFFFKDSFSLAIIFLTTLLLVPVLNKFINDEEEVEGKDGLKNFYKNHKSLFKVLFFLFLGIFFAFVVLSFLNQDLFTYQTDLLRAIGNDPSENILQHEDIVKFDQALGIISQNILVVVIAFILSIFYGAGALFLIILNASIFAIFISKLIYMKGASVLFLFLIHLVPELTGFFMASIAGAVMSRALFRENLLSERFSNVARDSLVILLISALLIVIAGFLEVYLVADLMKYFIL